MSVVNSISNVPSTKLISQESTTDSNFAEFIIQTSNDNSSTLAEVARFSNSSGTRYFRLASGTGGIQFGGDTAAANALDDYEEGSWTPRYSAATGGELGGSQQAVGFYTKIGDSVTVEGYVYISSINVTGKSGAVSISGLPFSSQSFYGPSAVTTTTNTATFGAFVNAPETVAANGAVMALNKARSGQVEQALDVTDFATAAGNRNIVYFRHTYLT